MAGDHMHDDRTDQLISALAADLTPVRRWRSRSARTRVADGEWLPSPPASCSRPTSET
jgi:hypothetical protein